MQTATSGKAKTCEEAFTHHVALGQGRVGNDHIEG